MAHTTQKLVSLSHKSFRSCCNQKDLHNISLPLTTSGGVEEGPLPTQIRDTLPIMKPDFGNQNFLRGKSRGTADLGRKSLPTLSAGLTEQHRL